MLAIFPEISAAVQVGDFERLGVLVRTYFGADQARTPRMDLEKLLRSFGAPVIRVPMEAYGKIAVRDERGGVLCSIAVRDGINGQEEAFTLAHLLGHLILHIQPRIARTEWSSSGFTEEQSPVDRYVHACSYEGMTAAQFALEDAADRFAGALLVPAAMLLRAKEKLVDLTLVGKLFGVSASLIERRLEDLNTRQVIKANAPVSNEHLVGAAVGGQRISKQAARATAAEDTAHMVREQHHKDAPLPRAVATQSYNTQAKQEPKAPSPGLSGGGMERLREIARMLDKSGR